MRGVVSSLWLLIRDTGHLVWVRYVVLMSGLNLGSSWSDLLSVEMMTDYITGQLGGVKVRPLIILQAKQG